MNRTLRIALILALFALLAGCGHEHENDVHAEGAEHDHGNLVEHGHDPEAIAVTHFTDRTELFVEYPALVVGEESAFAAHLTRLSDFRPVEVGKLTVRLSGGGLPEERFSVATPAIPGIFRPVAVPARSGTRRLELILESPGLAVTHDLGDVVVWADTEAAAAAQQHGEEETGLVSFLKEQQWKVDFATEPLQIRMIRASVPATAVIRARSDGEATVSAPSAGHLVPGEAFPRIGARIERGETLAVIAPQAGEGADLVSLELARERAQSQWELAVRERERVEGLVSDDAAPQRRLSEARSAERVARAELEAATQRFAQFQRALGGAETDHATNVAVRAPIDGTLAEIRVAAGSYVETGQPMFHLVATDRLWLEANVSEADLGRLREVDGAWFEVSGFDEPFVIDQQQGGRLVAFGNRVDPASRTTPVIFEFPNQDDRLRVGVYAQAHVWTGEKAEGVAVPVEALLDEAGQDVVYVMDGGESFERRVLRLGARDGVYVHAITGVEAGERVVTRGAYLVRLAAASPAEAGHGHAH